jgi:hypothetical protein
MLKNCKKIELEHFGEISDMQNRCAIYTLNVDDCRYTTSEERNLFLKMKCHDIEYIDDEILSNKMIIIDLSFNYGNDLQLYTDKTCNKGGKTYFEYMQKYDMCYNDYNYSDSDSDGDCDGDGDGDCDGNNNSDIDFDSKHYDDDDYIKSFVNENHGKYLYLEINQSNIKYFRGNMDIHAHNMHVKNNNINIIFIKCQNNFKRKNMKDKLKSEDDIIHVLKNNPHFLFAVNVFNGNNSLQNIKNMSMKMKMHAVKSSYKLIKYMETQNFDLCVEAVQTSGIALKFIHEQNVTMCDIAVVRSERALKYVKNKTLNICKLAVRHNGFALTHISHDLFDEYDYNEICKLALKENGYVMQHIKNQSIELCDIAINSVPSAIKYINEQTEDLCMKAIKKDGQCIKYIKNKTLDMCIESVRQNGRALKYIDDEYQTIEVCMIAIDNDPTSFKYVRDQIYELCEYAIKKDPFNICYVNEENLTYELTKKAYDINNAIIVFIIDPEFVNRLLYN